MTKKVTISLTAEQQEKARALSKDLLGKENISGYIGYLIEKKTKDISALQDVIRELLRIYVVEVDEHGTPKASINEMIEANNKAYELLQIRKS